MASIKDAFLRLIELSLYGHGVLHFIELGFAIYEEAYLTASIASAFFRRIEAPSRPKMQNMLEPQRRE